MVWATYSANGVVAAFSYDPRGQSGKNGGEGQNGRPPPRSPFMDPIERGSLSPTTARSCQPQRAMVWRAHVPPQKLVASARSDGTHYALAGKARAPGAPVWEERKRGHLPASPSSRSGTPPRRAYVGCATGPQGSRRAGCASLHAAAAPAAQRARHASLSGKAVW